MHKYRLGLRELDETLEGVNGGSGILVMGDVAGTQAIVYSLIRQGLEDGEGVILLPTMETGENALASYPDVKNLRVIDCMSRPLGLGSADSKQVKFVNGPADLTGMGVWSGRLVEEFKNRPVRLCIDSLSTLLMYSSLQVIFRFVHLLNGRVLTNGGLSAGTVDEGMHDPQTLAALRQLYRAALELRECDDACCVRAVGLTPRPTPWYRFEEVID